MATDVERLVVSLEASITKYERAMQKAVGQTNSTARRIEQRFVSMNTRLQSGFSAVGRSVATAFAGAVALRGAQQLIDTSTRIENSLKVAGLAGEELTRVYDSLFASAQRNAAPVESLVDLYGRAAIVQNELGVSSQELLRFTDNVAVALRVAGTDAQSASGALLQLSQALGSGTVRAEEFNSILEGALPIAQAAAAGLEEAGGSVAKLRALVVDGKVSSEAFFRAFEAGSVILSEKVAGAELTVSQGFVRLQNVLIDTAGKFDSATGASGRFVGFLNDVADAIAAAGQAADENAPALNRFFDFLSGFGNDLGNSMAEGTVSEFEAIAGAVDTVRGSLDRYGDSLTDAEIALAQAEQALATFAVNSKGSFGEVDAAAQDLFQQILEGKGSAELAAAAIAAIGADNSNFAGLMDAMGPVIQRIYEMRDAAVAAAAALPSVTAPTMAETRAEQNLARPRTQPATVTRVSLSDYPAPPIGSGGGGGGGQSPTERFADAMADQQRRIEELQRETDLRRQLGAAYDEGGYAAERLRIQMELENAAREAGIELTADHRAKIDEIASAYGLAATEAAALEAEQAALEEGFQLLGDIGRSAIDGVVSALQDGKIEANEFGEILSNVLSMAANFFMNQAFGSFGGGGGGGFNIMSLFGGNRAMGGPVDAGRIYRVNENTPNSEYWMPTQDGVVIPRLPKAMGGGGSSVTVAPIIHVGAGADAMSVQQLRQWARFELPDLVRKHANTSLPERG